MSFQNQSSIEGSLSNEILTMNRQVGLLVSKSNCTSYSCLFITEAMSLDDITVNTGPLQFLFVSREMSLKMALTAQFMAQNTFLGAKINFSLSASR